MSKRTPTVSVHAVVWNGMTHLPSSMAALARQTYDDYEVMVVDNGSIDSTVAWIGSEYPQFHLLRNTRNLGFCHGHNQALRLTDSTYVLALNQDVVLTPTWIEQAVRLMDSRSDIGAVGGKLIRYGYSAEELKTVEPSGILDSAGLRLYRTRHVNDRGSGQRDDGQYNGSEAVFGLNGACVLYRRSALESVRFQNEYLDEDFFAYKDDIDMAYRLLRQGWVNWYDGTVVAYHHRSVRGQSSTSNVQIARNFRRRQRLTDRLSYRNHWLNLMKNESWSSIYRDLPWVAWYELRKFLFLLVTRPKTIGGLFEALRLRPRILEKKRLIDHRAKHRADVIRNWFTP